jgi:hypothetical protein
VCSYSWRVPFSVGDGQLRIVASQPLGALGSSESDPLEFHWRWYCHVPALPLWALIGWLLVAPKANRKLQAWLILLPMLLVLAFWRMPLMLFSGSKSADGNMEILGFFVVSLVMGWSAVWLLGHWLSVRSRILTLVLIAAVMAAVVACSYFSHSEDATTVPPAAIAVYSGVCIALLSATMMLTGRWCRKGCSLGRFLLRLAVWFVAAVLMLTLGVFLLLLASGVPAEQLFRDLPEVASASAILAAILYLINLPFVVLAFLSPFYRDRLRRIFHMESDERDETGRPAEQARCSALEGPKDEPVPGQ